MADHSILRSVAVFRPMLPHRPIQTGRGLVPPAGLRRAAGFLAVLTADRGMAGHIARRTLGFGGRLGVFGVHHQFAAPGLSLDLRHRPQRRRDDGMARVARWPFWTAPPALAIPARYQEFIGLPVLPDEAANVAGMVGVADVPVASVGPGVSVGPDVFVGSGAGRPGIGRPGVVNAGLINVTPRGYPLKPADTEAGAPSLGERVARLMAQGEPDRQWPFAQLVLRRSHGERATRPPSFAGGGLAAVRRMPVQVDARRPMISVGDLGGRIAAQHAAPYVAEQPGGNIPAARSVVGGMSHPLLLAAWRRPAGADQPVHAADHPPFGGAPSWIPAMGAAGAALATSSPVSFPFQTPRRLREDVVLRRDVGAPVFVGPSGQPGSSLPLRAGRLERLGFGMGPDMPLPPFARMAAPIIARTAPERMSSPSPLLATHVLQRAAWQPPATHLPQDAGQIDHASTLPPGVVSAPASRSMRLAPLPTPLVAPLPASTLPPPSYTGGVVRQPTSVPNLLTAAPIAGPAELPMVSRRLAFGVDRVFQAATGAVSPVWGALGRFVEPTGAPAPATAYGAPVETPGRPSSRFVWSAPVAAPSVPGRSLAARSVPDLPVTRPIVYRSPFPDLAEPTAVQRAQAAEAMAGSTGQPLPPVMRRSMEHLFGGMDLASVRVHSGAAARRATDLVAARAMASGTDVFLPAGVPESPTAAGAPLLAHELTHVAHHLGHRPAAPPAPMTLARRFSGQEREADAIERSVADPIQRFSLPGGLPGGLPQSAMTLARPLINQAQTAAKSALQDAGEAVADKLPLAQIKDAVAAVTGAPAAGAAAPNPAQLAEQVYQLLERRLLVERERAGMRR